MVHQSWRVLYAKVKKLTQSNHCELDLSISFKILSIPSRYVLVRVTVSNQFMLCNQPHREKEKKYTDIHQFWCRLIKRSLYMKRVSKNFLGDFASRDENENICYRTKSPPKILPNVWCFTWQNIRCFAKNFLKILNTSKHKKYPYIR